MAIQKSKTLQNGATGNYWKITNISIDREKLVATCRVELFKDSSFSNIGSLGSAKVFRVTVTKQQIAGDITAVCYTAIKTQANQSVTNPVTHESAPKDADLAGGTDV